MGQPHKHAAVIKAWADGEEIEYFHSNEHGWRYTANPPWKNDTQFRVKPKNITVHRKVHFDTGNQITRTYYSSDPNIEYTFDPDGKLLDAKVLK